MAVVRMHGIIKRFPGVIANDGIDFDLDEGEIHALLGENGAGKTTLMKILSGLHRPDGGEIFIEGRRVSFKSPRDAINMGIGMVHQNFMLVSPHTVIENVILAQRRSGLFLRFGLVAEEIEALANRYGLKVDPAASIWQLSIGERQRVEIIKVLSMGARILVLDEPTSVLTPYETAELFATLRKMAGEGHSIVFISHKLEEVMAISDRISVLKNGKKVATLSGGEANEKELALLMVGKEVVTSIPRRRGARREPLLRVEGLSALNDRGLPALKGVSFTVHCGEILGIAGVAGNGQRELAEAITGIRPITRGRVFVGDREVTHLSPREIISYGVGHIPEERLGMGLAPNLGIGENIVLKNYCQRPFSRGPFLNEELISKHARRLMAEFGIAAPDETFPVRSLSGGNLQKVILAREMSAGYRVMVAAHPTRGLDIGATEFVQNALSKLKREGMAILLISEDLDEVLSLSDRIAVIYEGEIMGIVDAEEARPEAMGLMMTGTRIDEIRS